ncbi:Chromatin accessibility complex protein 1 [Pseudolycoriella hygida]|uniref:Chromatin accessibility complex protein 1 n=1 Tax=Pseudolycoriella hygida TaxID=35572 RepID=A0A9Q0S3M4_9DIPT|nr:Chromatin accessibility complex protein 1 [Pseudolycoriella hygida]
MPNATVTTEDAKGEFSLPAKRVRLIMKSSADPSVPLIKFETLHLVSKATEMLIKFLAKESIGKHKTLEYRHVADYVQSDSNLEFLHAILPKKISGREFRRLLKEESDNSDSNSSSGSSDEDDSSSSEESSSSDDGDEENGSGTEKTERKK